jgi:hypothetical protein
VAPAPAAAGPAAPTAGAPTPVPPPIPKALEESRAFDIFQKEIEPLLNREFADKSCITCHDEGGSSQLVLGGTALEDFNALLNGGYLSKDGPDTFLERIITHNPKKRMPKGKQAPPWSESEIGELKEFLTAVSEVVKVDGKVDERFPAALRTPYTGPRPESLDNQFLTYRQLRGKVRTIFQDDWVRNGEDRFETNLAQFGGADFKTRFNETSKASAGFLSALEILSRDVAERAYSRKTGPFEGWPSTLPAPETPDSPAAYRPWIARLYRSVLFRDPTEAEEQQSFKLIQGIYQAKQEILSSDFDLAFELEVTDPATGLKSQQTVSLPVSGEYHGLYQELIDETKRQGAAPIQRTTLAHQFQFKKGDHGQRFRLSNVNTFGNVSLAGIELKPIGASEVQKLPITAGTVQAEGAWKVNESGGTSSYEDGNVEKGTSNIVIPIEPDADGEYELTVLWRAGANNAGNVLVEAFCQEGNTLAIAPPPPAPVKGEAAFHYDSSAETAEEIPVLFKFSESDLVEISNQGTHDRVTASGVTLVPQGSGDWWLPASTRANQHDVFLDAQTAEGAEKWKPFDTGKFKAYNFIGTPLQDNGKNKGELSLRFKPSSKAGDAGWKPDGFYQVKVHFPGKAGNDQRVPVTIHAQASSPIIQVARPARARGESEVVLDASSSFTVQGSPLQFHWKQIDGPPVTIDAGSPQLHFTAPRRNLQQAAWVALCRGLIQHPDFVFTRAPSIEHAHDDAEKRRLQLVKLALDLTGHPPTASQVANLANGMSLEKMADAYLKSDDFRDFYFHRIRLYLESHGTESQDEPARLWCYVAFNDLPMQQILTADYTVDQNFQKQPRPAYHGHTGVLTTKGFIEGKPGLPHYNYAAQVAMLFLGYVFEVPPEVVEQRQGSTAASTVDPNGICYSCHKVLTPLAIQRNMWTDEGRFRTHDEYGLPIEASDGKMVDGYPFPGEGLEAFATQAVKKERFFRTIIDTHVTFYFGRQMRWQDDERALYQRVWDRLQHERFTIRSLIRTLVTSPEYLEGKASTSPPVSASVN